MAANPKIFDKSVENKKCKLGSLVSLEILKYLRIDDIKCRGMGLSCPAIDLPM